MRVKRGVTSHRRHKRLLKKAKGYRGRRKTTIRLGHQAVIRAGAHAYRDRRKKKRVFRSLWIARLNAALRAQGIPYSRFIRQMEEKNVRLNRKVLSELAISEPRAFEEVVKTVMS